MNRILCDYDYLCQAEYRDRDEEFVYPYDMGCTKNMSEVLCTSDGWPKSNGFQWDVLEGCGQFDLTVCNNKLFYIIK